MCLALFFFLNVPNNSLCGYTHQSYLSSIFLWNLLSLASVWIGCFLGSNASCPSMTIVLNLIFLAPKTFVLKLIFLPFYDFCWIPWFPLSVFSCALVESTFPLFHEKMCRRGKTLFACLEIYLMLLKHSIDYIYV